jgi:sulfur-oxidizing protein SoxX
MNLKAVTGLIVAGIAFVGTAVAETAPSDVVWVDEVNVPAILTNEPGDAAGGVGVVSSRSQGNCVACHQISALPDVAFQGNVGPSLDGVGSRWTEAELRGILVDAKQMFPETRMPSFYRDSGYIRPGDRYTGRAADPETFAPLLDAQQIEDTISYLMTLTD